MCKSLIGGDQLTVARVCGNAAARIDHQIKKDRLEGFVPVVEDWHAKQCHLKVNWVYIIKQVFLKGNYMDFILFYEDLFVIVGVLEKCIMIYRPKKSIGIES